MELDNKLYWQYGYKEVSEEMAEKYAYAELIGPDGPMISSKIIIGLVLLGPDFIYPEHSHNQIEESYIFLSGKTIYNNRIVFGEGSFVFNQTGQKHELKTTVESPSLILYAWTGKRKVLSNYKMKLK